MKFKIFKDRDRERILNRDFLCIRKNNNNNHEYSHGEKIYMAVNQIITLCKNQQKIYRMEIRDLWDTSSNFVW